MSKFQLIITSIFIVCIIGGVIAFANFKGNTSQSDLPTISIWGTYSNSTFTQLVAKINLTLSPALKIDYTQINESDFDNKFIGALASGKGPDVILIPQDMIYKHEDKLLPIPYTSLTQGTYQSTFVRQADLYLGANGIYALPFSIDPLVMYWNKDTFTNNGIALPPKYWDEFTSLNTKLTKKDVNSNISKTAIALGEFSNIQHAREILGTLFMQSGNLVTYTDNTGTIASALGSHAVNGLDTSVPALNFFTQFSNPSSANYSWNRAISDSKSAFLSGTLATYFGFASEVNDLREKNPNLNFDISPFPQAKLGKNRITYANMYGFSIVKGSSNVNTAFSVISALTSSATIAELVKMTYLPPVRRDLIASGTTDPYLSIFYDASLIAKNWLDMDKTKSGQIFQGVVESITSGRQNTIDAVQDGSDKFDLLLKGSI